jgi:iron complex outermembrane receptor protein
MFRKTKVCTGLMLAFGGAITLPALAQQTLERVEITGSAIKRIDAETAVPVTVVKMDDLKKQGVTTIEQALATISASQSILGTSQAVGAATGGASFANLRGLGQNKTLVLLNGRRLANNTIDGSAPDLNMIPFAALDRVEVLRDGASALYGTDAIGGVINFITKGDLTGGTVTVQAEAPQHAGGKSYNASIVAGTGDLAKNGFNILGALDLQKQNRIRASQRAFGSTGYIPGMGIFRSSGSSDPANYDQGGAGANPAGPACNSNPFIFHQSGFTCREDFAKYVDLVPQTERESGYLRGTLNLNQDHHLNVEYLVSRFVGGTQIAPVPFAALTMDPGTPFFPGNGITPAPTNFTIDPTQPINLRWRDTANGPRQEEDRNLQQRFTVGLEGVLAGWDYNTAITFNQNKNTHNTTGGYADGDIITPGVQTGIINPFGDQTAAGQALLDSALVKGKLYGGKMDMYTVDGHASRELGDWAHAGRPAQLAVGAEFRHEKIAFAADPVNAARLVASTGIDPGLNDGGSRSVAAIYGELNVPLSKTFEITGALRYDKYSDFGNTTNPKVSFRWQPNQQVLLRGAYSTGFRAPSLFELNNPITYTNTANAWNDPIRCPGGVVQPGFSEASVCNTQFIVQNGGNKNLQPEKSKSLTYGLAFEPAKDFTATIDFWVVRLTNQINVLPDTLIFADPTKNAGLFHRAPDGHLSIDGSECPGTNCGYITDTTDNLGGLNASGVDLGGTYRMRTAGSGTFTFGFNGTYITKYEYQQERNGVWLQNAGTYSGSGPIMRWQHMISVAWNQGAWGAGLVNRFKTAYWDQNDPNQVDPQFFDRVASYSLWDTYASWSPTKAILLTAGIHNLFDRNPPFSNQGATFQVGYEPRLTDPAGRSYYLRASYSF